MDTLLHIETHAPGFGPIKHGKEIQMEEVLIFMCFDVAVKHASISKKSDCR